MNPSLGNVALISNLYIPKVYLTNIIFTTKSARNSIDKPFCLHNLYIQLLDMKKKLCKINQLIM